MAEGLDVYLRHQGYAEGFKNGEGEEQESAFEEIAAIIVLLLTKLGIDRLADLNKRDFAAFVADVNRNVYSVFNKRGTFTVERLREFLKTDLAISVAATQSLSGKSVGPINGERIIKETENAPVAGLGDTPAAIYATTLASIVADIRRRLTMSYANSETVADLIKAIVGTKALKRKDGLLPKLARRMVSASDTIYQHGISYLNHKLGSFKSDRYQWISVLDSGTTDICRSRSLNIYEYGKGPRPPAHYRCRSTTIPVIGQAYAEVPTFFAWITQQPYQVQVDLMGQTKANAARRGELRSDELGSFGGNKSLTLAEYRAKGRIIITGT